MGSVAVAAIVFLVLGVAVGATDDTTGGGAKSGSFKSAAGLVTDDATRGGTEERAGRGAALRVRAGGSRAARKSDGSDDSGGRSEDRFHGC